jgi:septum formation protein
MTSGLTFDLVLASSSRARANLLVQAGIPHRIVAARVDEEAIKQSLLSEQATPHDIADALAELKARKVAEKHATAFVLGCDQTLSLGTRLFSKPGSADEAVAQLTDLQGQTHVLHSAVVLYENAKPVWRHVAKARMTMRPLSPDFIARYVARNWPAISFSVGGYLIESEGVALFSEINGEFSCILGLPLPPLISYLASRGLIAS